MLFSDVSWYQNPFWRVSDGLLPSALKDSRNLYRFRGEERPHEPTQVFQLHKYSVIRSAFFSEGENMADYNAIKKAFQERYQADLDVGIVLGFKGDLFSVADVVFDRDGKDVAVKIVREEDTIGSISQFFNECQSEGFYPLFLFRSPNSSPQAVVCSYLNSAAFAIDEHLDITPFKVDREGLKVSKKTFSIEDFKCRKRYHINYTIDLFGFFLRKGDYQNFFLDLETEYRVLVRQDGKTKKKNRKRNDIYDEKELEDLFLSMEYGKLFEKLYPVIRYGLNLALEDRCCDEDMVQDVCLIIWKKILDDGIKKPGSIGAFTISVCRLYICNHMRKMRGRRRVEEKLFALMDVFGKTKI